MRGGFRNRIRMAELVITIDGPAGSGKSTAAQLLAQKLGATFLDTGAMYRAVTLAAMEARVDMSDEAELIGIIDTRDFSFRAEGSKMLAFIDGEDVTEKIREPVVTANAKYAASSAQVRRRLVQMQREFAAGEEKIVTEGRDQGTVAFPDADFKFFLTADIAERARRRQAELLMRGINKSVKEIQEAIEQRDNSDSSRGVGPLKKGEGAVVIDTTYMDIDEVVDKLARTVCK